MPKCTAKTKRGTPCQRDAEAGWNVCHVHGAGGGRPPTTTLGLQRLAEREAQRLNSATYQHVQAHLQRPDLLDCNRLAAVCYELVERAQFAIDSNENNAAESLLAAVDQARKLAESIVKIQLMQSELYSRKQSELIHAALVRFVASVPEELKPSLREAITGVRVAASLPELPEPTIEAEIVE